MEVLITRFPRPGHPIVPAVLAPVLRCGILVRERRGQELRIDLAEANEAVWTRLDEESCQRLAQTAVRMLRTRIHLLPESVITRPIFEGMQDLARAPGRLELNKRTWNVLVAEGWFGAAGEKLQPLTIQRALVMDGFGPSCLLDLLVSAEALHRDLPVRPGEPIGPSPDSQCRKSVSTGSPLATLEEELERLFQGLNHESHLGAARAYLGIDRPGVSYGQAGKPFGLGREYVRIICNRIKTTASLRSLPFTFLDAILARIARWTPGMLSFIQGKLVEEVKEPNRMVSVEGLLKVARFLERPGRLKITRCGQERIVEPEESLGVVNKIQVRIRSVVVHRSVATMGDVVSSLAQHDGLDVSKETVSALATELEGFSWLDPREGWFWLRLAPRNQLWRCVSRMIAAAGRISIEDLNAGLLRFPLIRELIPPPHVLAEFVRQHPGCVVDGHIVTGDPEQVGMHLLTPSERSMCRALQVAGGAMRYFELLRATRSEGSREMPAGFSPLLNRSPLFVRYTRGVWGLRGVPVAPERVQALRSLPPPDNLRRASGSLKGGRFWAGYRLSEKSLRWGRLRVPPWVRSQLRGVFDLCGPDGRRTANWDSLRAVLSGLRSWYRRLHARAGDVLVLVIDPPRKRIHLSIRTLAWLRRVLQGKAEPDDRSPGAPSGRGPRASRGRTRLRGADARSVPLIGSVAGKTGQ